MDIKKELLELFDDPLLDGARPFAKAITADERIMQKMICMQIAEKILKAGTGSTASRAQPKNIFV